jgi:uncharacterized protein
LDPGHPQTRWRRYLAPTSTGVFLATPAFFPVLGTNSGRQAVADFVRDSASMVERISFEVHDVLANDDRAVILGGLSTRIKSTGKIINTAFAIILTIVGGEITHS